MKHDMIFLLTKHEMKPNLFHHMKTDSRALLGLLDHKNRSNYLSTVFSTKKIETVRKKWRSSAKHN